MMGNDKEWDRISKALFSGVPERVSPGFKERVLANLEAEPRRLPLSWLAPAFAAALLAVGMIVSPPDDADDGPAQVELVMEAE